MKKLTLTAIALVLVVLLTACFHEHQWVEASCIAPKTCETCGAVEGEILPHAWQDATCTAPKTCSTCKATEGEALGHKWADATCTSPVTCTVCNTTQGNALGHDTPGLTCTQDATCTRCNVTVTAPGHTLTEATCTEAAKCSTCGTVSGKALGHTVSSGVCGRCGLESYATVSGSGDDVVSDIAVGDGIYRVHFTHSGRSNFIVKSYDSENDKELLVNEIGKYNGYVLLNGKSPFAFEISADGSWTYTVERLGKISDTSFAGKGDYVTGLCSLSSGVWEFTHDGKSNFIVKIYTTDGRDLLINEIGKYDGKKMVTIPAGSVAMFEISADGNWTIKKS